MSSRILVIEDDAATLRMVELALKKGGYLAVPARSWEEARRLLDSESFDAVLSDLYLGDGSGLEVLKASRERASQRPVIMFTARGSVETAVEAIRAGAYDYLPKPFRVEELLRLVDQAVGRAESGQEVVPVPDHGEEASLIIGNSPSMVHLYKKIALVAPTAATVLITGETGTGKELVARSLHRFSDRRQGPFVAVNCGALAENLLEAELFGHERGAFTDAFRSRPGLFETADRGTLFLDEISETSKALQVKLLRALQEGEIRPVGGTRAIRTSTRVLASCNRDLRELVQQGEFRQDLYYRLSVVHLEVPPLRERVQDIPKLASYFLTRASIRLGRPFEFSEAALAALCGYDWPGNVRELENAIERAAILKTDPRIQPEDFEFSDSAPHVSPLEEGLTELDKVERRKIQDVLADTGGNKAEAARRLGIERKSLYRKARRLGIDLDAIPAR